MQNNDDIEKRAKIAFEICRWQISWCNGGIKFYSTRNQSVLFAFLRGWFSLTAVGLYCVFTLVGIRPILSLLLTILFIIHPQRVESLVWISERKDVLCSAFYIWALYWFIKLSPNKLGKSYWGPFFLFILALFSKSIAVTLPFILMLYEWQRRSDFSFIQSFKLLSPYFVAVIAVIPVTILSPGGAIRANQDIFHRIIVISQNFYWYLGKFIFPFDLNPFYPKIIVSHHLIISVVVFYCPAVTLLIMSYRRNQKYSCKFLFPLLLTYPISVAPVIGIFSLGAIDVADRYNLIPSIFILMIIGFFVEHSVRGVYPSFDDCGTNIVISKFYILVNNIVKQPIVKFI